MKFGKSGSAAIGVSGHYGTEKWGVEDSTETASWSFNTDVKLTLCKKAYLSGEFFVGESRITSFTLCIPLLPVIYVLFNVLHR